MAQNAYIKLVPASKKQNITISEVKELLHHYKQITSKTNQQLNWKFDDAAFPYEIMETEDGKHSWFYLKSNRSRYNTILIGVDNEEIYNIETEENVKQTYIQITLPDTASHGDKGKAIEFSRFISKHLQAELHLFNGRIMYYYKR